MLYGPAAAAPAAPDGAALADSPVAGTPRLRARAVAPSPAWRRNPRREPSPPDALSLLMPPPITLARPGQRPE